MSNYKGWVSYQAEFPGIEFGQIDFANPPMAVAKATVQSSADNKATCLIEIARAASVEVLLAGADEAAARITEILTFTLERYFFNFKRVAQSLVEEQPDGSATPIQHLGSNLDLHDEAKCVKAISAQQVAELRAVLERKRHRGFSHYEQFRAALGLTDPISTFMGLYGILLALHKDQQKLVDDFIRKVEPSVPTSLAPAQRKRGQRRAKKRIKETVYTRLRNQVGHVRAKTTLEGTRTEMSNNLMGLIKITKESISRQR